jgi:hypothetical protein
VGAAAANLASCGDSEARLIDPARQAGNSNHSQRLAAGLIAGGILPFGVAGIMTPHGLYQAPEHAARLQIIEGDRAPQGPINGIRAGLCVREPQHRVPAGRPADEEGAEVNLNLATPRVGQTSARNSVRARHWGV